MLTRNLKDLGAALLPVALSLRFKLRPPRPVGHNAKPGPVCRGGLGAHCAVATVDRRRGTLPLHAHAAPRVTVHPRLKSQVESAPALRVGDCHWQWLGGPTVNLKPSRVRLCSEHTGRAFESRHQVLTRGCPPAKSTEISKCPIQATKQRSRPSGSFHDGAHLFRSRGKRFTASAELLKRLRRPTLSRPDPCWLGCVRRRDGGQWQWCARQDL
jgi:hypothetical protein